MSALSGGCQCGAVRFRLEGPIRRTTICHCRMCQKATGSAFGAFAGVAADHVTWTRGQRAQFQSSGAVVRGFCKDCGTPLTFERLVDGDTMGLTIGAFDRPADITPGRQIGLESRLGWLDDLNTLPVAPIAAEMVSRQHPDHDTDVWPVLPHD